MHMAGLAADAPVGLVLIAPAPPMPIAGFVDRFT